MLLRGPCSSYLVAGAILAACSGSTSGPAPDDRLRVVAEPATSDTVTATPSQGLVVEVHDEAGLPVAGVIARFTALAVDSPPGVISMGVGSVSSPTFGSF